MLQASLLWYMSYKNPIAGEKNVWITRKLAFSFNAQLMQCDCVQDHAHKHSAHPISLLKIGRLEGQRHLGHGGHSMHTCHVISPMISPHMSRLNSPQHWCDMCSFFHLACCMSLLSPYGLFSHTHSNNLVIAFKMLVWSYSGDHIKICWNVFVCFKDHRLQSSSAQR